jgi:putative ABC transport system permease protein
MIRHLLRLAWNRKRANVLLMLEIFGSFLVLFAVVTLSAWFAYLFSLPTGFDPRNVWCVTVSRGGDDDRKPDAAEREAFDRLLTETRNVPGVRSAAVAFGVPYDGHVWDGDWTIDGRRYTAELDDVSDDFAKVMGIPLVAGRWFARR